MTTREDLAIELVREAAVVVREKFGRHRDTHYKTPKDLVTEADLAAEAVIIEHIQKQFPEDTIFSEEAGDLAGSNEYGWIIDPIDGTTNFAAGIPYFCVAIAVTRHGKPFATAIYEPMRDVLYAAQTGAGATRNGDKIEISQTPTLDRSLVTYAASLHRDERMLTEGASLFAWGIRHTRAMRLIGSSLLDLCLVAEGTYDGLVKIRPHYWDIAAGCLLVEEAGGVATDLDGAPWGKSTQHLIAGNPLVQPVLREGLGSVLQEG